MVSKLPLFLSVYPVIDEVSSSLTGKDIQKFVTNQFRVYATVGECILKVTPSVCHIIVLQEITLYIYGLKPQMKDLRKAI